jgi:hypothetical protein
MVALLCFLLTLLDLIVIGGVFRQRCSIQKAVAPCGHLGLFMGREILAQIWPDIARWLSH